MNPADIQRKYYEATASQYDSMHVSHDMGSEHELALSFLSAVVGVYSIQSILDVGAGTGRVVHAIQARHPKVKITGVEPVKALRMMGYEKGISEKVLIEGDGNHLNFEDATFDIVCEFGVLHHVPHPERVIKEMLRVAKVGIFISDSNNFGQGGFLARTLKQTLNTLGLWPAYNFIRTRGKKYQITKGDGLFYSYSVFNNYKIIRKKCKSVHIMNTQPGGINPYKTATHVALLGIKKDDI